MSNENVRDEYKALQEKKRTLETELQALRGNYDAALSYATNHREQYERLKNGKKEDELTLDKIAKTELNINDIAKAERTYRQQADDITKSLETDVVMQKLASAIKNEVEAIKNYKGGIEEQRKNNLTDTQIEYLTRKVVEIMSGKYEMPNDVDVEAIVNAIKYSRDNNDVKD